MIKTMNYKIIILFYYKIDIYLFNSLSMKLFIHLNSPLDTVDHKITKLTEMYFYFKFGNQDK